MGNPCLFASNGNHIFVCKRRAHTMTTNACPHWDFTSSDDCGAYLTAISRPAPDAYARLPAHMRVAVAAFSGDADQLKLLLPEVPTPASALAVSTPVMDNLWPLHAAAANGTLDVVRLLVQHGADVNQIDVHNGDAPIGRVLETLRWDALSRALYLATHPTADAAVVAAACDKADAMVLPCDCRKQLVAAVRSAVRTTPPK